ncbi:hypothetical protein QQP08_023841 [Theobroma cacao]|nr:hypothetical protein QQP08_023841 [Theobroma cacao]
MVVLLFFVLALPNLFLFILLKQRNNGNILLPPGPPGLPLIGHLHMGVSTLELALANLLYKFDWEMPAGMNKEDFDVIPGLYRFSIMQMDRHRGIKSLDWPARFHLSLLNPYRENSTMKMYGFLLQWTTNQSKDQMMP